MLTTHTCGTCGIPFAVPENWITRRRQEGGDIHCPNGCRRVWSESEADKLKKQLHEKETQLQAKSAELTAAKCQILEREHKIESLTKKVSRVEKGCCPHCRRHFTNLQRHVETVHLKKPAARKAPK